MRKEELDNKINQELSGWSTPLTKSKNEIWEEVKGNINYDSPPLHSINRWRWVAAASILAIAISIGAYKTSNVEVYSNEQAQNLTLPDGSTLRLNTNSNVTYNTIGWFFNRSVSLSGEGFFTVKKGQQFDVITENGVVSVLGTSFNVFDRNNEFRVDCFTGRVSVDNGTTKSVITKGEFVEQTDKFVLIKQSNLETSLSPNWITGNYAYKNEQLAIVLHDISTRFNISINASNKISKLSFTGAWNNTMTLEEVLKIVCLPFNLEASSTDKTVYNLVFLEN